jgi:lipopolysaccharide transport system ATP-binding protein
LSTNVISVDNLGKQYHIGQTERGYTTFREALTNAARAPLDRLRRLSGASTSHESFWALQNASFRVKAGDAVAIIGRNGAGKSTLLKILSRITEPSTGRAELKGRVASLLEVGTGFHPELTGRENIYLNGAIIGMRRAEIRKRFDQIVEFAETGKFLDTPVKRYSSGMHTRLAFAVAAHLDAEVLIVDEVLAVGDAAFQAKCLDRMKSITRNGRTVIFVSHNMAAIEGMCTRGIVFEHGSIAFEGDQLEAIQHYYRLAARQAALGSYASTTEQFCGAARFASIRISSREGATPGVVAIGDSIQITVEIDSVQDLLQPAVGIAIETARGVRVVTFNTRTSDPAIDFRVRKGRNLLTCEAVGLPLAPGTYAIRARLEDGGQVVESVERAASFRVTDSDFFRSGGRGLGGVIYWRHRWSPADASHPVSA